jgi:hypothetical protein
MATLLSGYRFSNPGGESAYLDNTGKLYLRDDRGNLEIFASWSDYVRDVLKDKPTTGGEDAIVAQLSVILGIAEEVSRDPSDKKPIKKMEENQMPKGVYNRSKKSATSPASVEAALKAPTKANEKAKKAASAPNPVPVGKKAVGSKKPAPATKKTASVKRSASDGLPLCLCGCGKMVLSAKRNFLQGHDSRFHSMVGKIEKGEMQIGDLNAQQQEYYAETVGKN